MKYAFLASAAAVLVLQSGTAFAQDADSEEQGAYDGDIVVTATRTETLLSKTPIALTAISGDQLTESGITNPTQLEESVPNVSIVRGNGLQITIRGVTSTDGTEKGDPSAAFMLDGVYIARPQAQEVSFFDIERVEVLRGPQGTLYGRNSTAGVINIISTRPKQELGGSIDASYGNFDHINATAAINLPVSSTFAIRAAANIDRRDNFVIDNAPNDGVDIDPFKKNMAFRLSALWEPSSDFSALLIADYSEIKGVPMGSVPPSNFFSTIPSGGRQTFERPTYFDSPSNQQRLLNGVYGQTGFRDNTDKGVMGELNYSTGPVTFTYVGSYRESERFEITNIGFAGTTADFAGDYWQTSHELRAAYGDGPIQLQVGGYYFKEKSGIAFFINNFLAPDSRFGFPQDPTIAENKSVFGQLTYEIAPDLKLTGGVRYSHDKKSRVGNTVLDIYDSVVDSYNVGNLIVRNIFQDNDAAGTFSKVTWRAGIDYDSALGLIFASVSTGYKAGGFNDGCLIGDGPRCVYTENELFYQPETLTAYEAGFKFSFSPEFRMNGTVFHYDYSNLQLSQVGDFGGCGSCQLTTNAGKATVDGVELEATIQPVYNFTIRLAANYLDAKYKQFTPGYTVGTTSFTVDFAGRALNRSPKYTWTAGLNYMLPVGDGELVFDAQTRFSSKYELTDLGNFAYFYQPSFTKSDISVTYKAPDDRFYLGAFVENLENDLVLTGVTTGFFGSATFADPRTYGVRAGVNF